MKIELHSHTSRYSPCAMDDPDTLIKGLIRAGYEAVFITEHERVWSHSEIRLLQASYPQIKIFPGVELAVGPKGLAHLLVLGTTDQEYIWLQREPATLLEKARNEGHLTILAHPFRWPEAAEMILLGMQPDALEFLTNNHNGELADQSQAAATKFGLKLVNAGDLHAAKSINNYWIESEFPLEHPGDIRPIVMGERYILVPELELG